MAKKSKRLGEFEELPEACIAVILSHTTPIDACSLSLVSKTLHSASESDDVWNYFLPSDSNFLNSIIPQSPSLANAPTKKALFIALSDRPIVIDNGKKIFQLGRKSGKISYMLPAKSLTIEYKNGGARRKKKANSMLDSRFPEVTELYNVLRFEIRGTINTPSLSPNTNYAAYLVFKMNGYDGFKNQPAELSVGVEDGSYINKSVCLDPYFSYPETGHHHHRRYHSGRRGRQTVCKCLRLPKPRLVGLKRPCVRTDGWFEIEMGKFFNSSLEDKQVRMSVVQKQGCGKMENFFLEGIQVRPK